MPSSFACARNTLREYFTTLSDEQEADTERGLGQRQRSLLLQDLL